MDDLWFWTFIGVLAFMFALRTDNNTSFLIYSVIFAAYMALLMIKI